MTDSAVESQNSYAILLAYGTATLRLDPLIHEAKAIRDQVANEIRSSLPHHDQEEIRREIRESIRVGVLENRHVDPIKSQGLAQLLIYFVLSSPQHSQAELQGYRGYILSISELGGKNFNFRLIVTPDEIEVDQACERARAGQTNIIGLDAEEVGRAQRRKKQERRRDPSLTPPARPRPDLFLPALKEMEDTIGVRHLSPARRCLEAGTCFVYRSRQIAAESQEEIEASLAAMAEFDRLHLPFPEIWVETKDWLELYSPDFEGGQDKRETRLGIAAYEKDADVIAYYGFAELERRRYMSILEGEISRKAFASGSVDIVQGVPPLPDDLIFRNESFHRKICQAAGERLLELLFLLSTQGIEREKVRAGEKPLSLGKASTGKRRKKRRAKPDERDYVIVRVPLSYDPEARAKSADGATEGKGRWLRPHVRRAHMWGKNTRPASEQRWVEATLVGASRADADELPDQHYLV